MGEPARFHVALNVADLESSRRFYRAALGLAPDKEHAGYVRFVLDEPPLVLSLNAAGAGRPGDRVAHLGLRLAAGPLTEARARVVGAGYPVRDQREVLCCHSVQTKFWVEDPDGNLWEFYELLDDRPEEKPPQEKPPQEKPPQEKPAEKRRGESRPSSCCP